MSFNLNGEEFKSTAAVVFNNGEAGKVENVRLSVEKKASDAPDNAPEYKVIFTDESNASINMGIYYPTPNPMYDEVKNDSLQKLSVGRVLSIARAVMGADYQFPTVSTAKEAIDVCMKLIAQNCEGKRVNVFVTYGTVGKPNKYLGIYKNFDFIEEYGTKVSRLRPTFNPNPEKQKYNDLMERIVEDESSTERSVQEPAINKEQSWL